LILKKKTQTSYLDERFSMICEMLHIYLKSQNQEDLHVMRVQLKKYKAWIELYSLFFRTSKLNKKLKPIKKLFRLAGAIRDLHISQALMVSHEVPLKNANDEFEQTALKLFQNLQNKADKLEKSCTKNHKKLCAAIAPIAIKDFEKFIATHVAQFEKEKSSDDAMHDWRKDLKRLLYIKDVMNKKQLKRLSINFEYIDQLQDKIGAWHDALLFHQFLQQHFPHQKAMLNKAAQATRRLFSKASVSSEHFAVKFYGESSE